MNYTKEKIINESLKLFSREGFNSVSIARITRAVGIAKSSLYTHFKTKEEILDAIYELYEETRTAQRIDPKRLETMVEVFPAEQFWIEIQTIYRRQWDSIASSQVGRFLNIEQYKSEKAMELMHRETKNLLESTEYFLKRQLGLKKIRCPDTAGTAIEYVYGIKGLMRELDILQAHSKNTDEIEQRINHFIKRFSHRLTEEINHAVTKIQNNSGSR